tara:strand:- start:1572 stop:2492 length:921 start_codon:yes stop_codon:yes gene_type:complete
MSLLNQKTISSEILFDGIGLHSGLNVSMRLLPAGPNHGIKFKRTDLKNNNIVDASIFNVVSTKLCTTIGNNTGVKVSTIEHLMAAFYGLGIDNIMVELDNVEVPIMDGSSKEFVDKIIKVGLKENDIPIKIIKINKRVEVKENGKIAFIDKSVASLNIEFEIKYKNKLIGNQKNKINVYESDLSSIFSSRTFCLYEDINQLRSMGLAKGGSLDNAVVVKDNKILNKDGLRNDLEFVNHKILDCIGDLYLSGYKMIGSIFCSQGGHDLTNKLLKKVFSDEKNYSIFEIKEKNLPHYFVNKSQLKSIA